MKKREEERKKREARAKMSESEKALQVARNSRVKKPKVAPKVASLARQRQLLRRAMKHLNIGGSKKIDMASSDSESDSSSSDGMDIDEARSVPKVKKVRRSPFNKQQMKKEARRRRKMDETRIVVNSRKSDKSL